MVLLRQSGSRQMKRPTPPCEPFSSLADRLAELGGVSAPHAHPSVTAHHRPLASFPPKAGGHSDSSVRIQNVPPSWQHHPSTHRKKESVSTQSFRPRTHGPMRAQERERERERD